jgi:hypothetical protein
MVGLDRLELSTSPLSGVRSNHLSYRPAKGSEEQRRGTGRDTVLPPGVRQEEREAKAASSRKRGPSRDGLNDPSRSAEQTGQVPFEHWPIILRKEVIQPQVPLRLPCYDFTPVADPTVVACLPCGLAQRRRVEPTPMV